MKKKFVNAFSIILCLISLFNFLSLSAQKSNDSRILLQGFYWDCYMGNEGNWYNIVSSKADEIASVGIDMVWLPAPSVGSGGMGYLPSQLNVLSNSFGSEKDQKNMLNKLNSLGVEPVADVVINHRVGTTNWADFTNPSWDGTRSIVNSDEVWGQSGYQNLARGGHDTGENYPAARDLDHTNGIVRQGIKDWLNMLKSIGYKGWRYDLVKGYAPHYTAEYNGATSPTFSVGEFYDFDKQKVQRWVDGANKQSTAFDFPTYATIKDAIKDNNYSYLVYEGKASGLIGWSPAQSTTFIENHDTPRYDGGRNILNPGNVCIGYAYLLTHPGVPTIYWPHYFDWDVKDKINQLIAVRKNAGITSTSSLNIVKGDPNCYAAIVNGNVAVKLGSADWSPGNEFVLQTSGNNYAVWMIDERPRVPVVSITQGGNFPSGAVTVSISATENGEIYYTLDGSDPDKESKKYTGSFELTEATTVKAIAYNNEGESEVKSQKYTFKEVGTLTFMWKTTATNNPTIHIWNVDGNPDPITTWPGAIMKESQEYQGWYYYTVDGLAANVIFNGVGGQTDDLVNVSDNDGEADDIVWYDNGWVSKPVEKGMTIYYKGNYSHIYIWDNQLNQLAPWPGLQMKDADGDGWYEFYIDNAECANVIFNHNGSQTDDLYRCGNGWYKDGVWYDSNPEQNLKSEVFENEELGNLEKVVEIYPNPANEVLYMNNVQEDVRVKIYNPFGKLVLSNMVVENQLDISELKTGMYVIKIGDETRKLFVK